MKHKGKGGMKNSQLLEAVLFPITRREEQREQKKNQ